MQIQWFGYENSGVSNLGVSGAEIFKRTYVLYAGRYKNTVERSEPIVVGTLTTAAKEQAVDYVYGQYEGFQAKHRKAVERPRPESFDTMLADPNWRGCLSALNGWLDHYCDLAQEK